MAAYTVGGLGLAALTGSVAFYVVAFAEEGRAQNRIALRESGGLDSTGVNGYNSALANRNAFRVAGTGAAVGGIAMLAGGFALFTFDTPDPKSVPLRAPDEPRAKPKNEFEVSFVPLVAPGSSGTSGTSGVYGLGAVGRF